MAQDFAKQRNNPDGIKRKRAVSTAPAPGNANWSWYFSGLMTGVIVSIAAYLGVVKLEEGVVEDAEAVQAGTTPEDQPTYSFYEVLSNAEVVVNRPDAPAAAQDPADTSTAAVTSGNPDVASATANVTPVAASEDKPALYLLQAGSFQNKDGAENQRARIILLNMNANVVEGIVGGRTHYSVQVGPFTGRQSAKDASDLLSGNDIESITLMVPPP